VCLFLFMRLMKLLTWLNSGAHSEEEQVILKYCFTCRESGCLSVRRNTASDASDPISVYINIKCTAKMWHKTRYVAVCCDQRVHKKSRIGEGLRDARTTCAGRSHSPMRRIMQAQGITPSEGVKMTNFR